MTTKSLRSGWMTTSEALRDALSGGELPAGAIHGDKNNPRETFHPRMEVRELIEDDPKRGFRHAGEFFLAVRKEGVAFSNPTDPRLRIAAAAPTTFGSENLNSGQDGGFAVPYAFAQDIANLALLDDSLLPFCDVTPISTNSMVFPQSEIAPWGTGGSRAFWLNEGAAGTQNKPAVRGDVLRVNKLMSLVPVTDELSEDAVALGPYLTTEMGNSIRWKCNESLLFGNDIAQPMGVFTSGSSITVAKESGQATQTLVTANLAKMLARLPPGSFARAIWLLSGDSLPAFFAMTALGTVFFPGGGDLVPSAKAAVLGLIMGRPAIVSAHAKAFSAQGDVMLLDLNYVRAIERAPGVVIASSMHVYFDADAVAFRATYRIDAQPKITTPINPANGSTTLSPFIQLGAR